MLNDLQAIARDFPWFFPAVAAVFGAIVGSFLNVVIYRLPAGKSVVHPGSHCGCGKAIAWYDNVPILSWLLLRGRARCCGARFSFRYPFVEALTAALFLACALLFPLPKALCGMLFAACMVCATYIDLDHLIIPDVFTIGLAAAGLVLSIVAPSLHIPESSEFYPVDALRSLTAALQGMLVGSGLILWIALVAETLLKKEAMGFGDVKFMGAIGAFCGWQGAVFALFGGAVIGTVWFILALLWQKLAGRTSPVAPRAETPDGQPADLGFGVHVPFGPMLAMGGLAHFLWGHRWTEAYFGALGSLL
jgi:leader peptidase (prepilin peptidase) / N-methyltransferase